MDSSEPMELEDTQDMHCVNCGSEEAIGTCDNDCGTFVCMDCDVCWYVIDGDIYLGHVDDCGAEDNMEDYDSDM